MQASKRFSAQCIEQLRSEIEDSRGNEVFALGYLDDQGLVTRLDIRARGNEGSVLALQDWSEVDTPELPDAEDLSHPADVLIHNHPNGLLTPSDEDMTIAGRAAEAGTGCYIVDNRVSKVYVVAEPTRRRKRVLLDGDAICASLEPGGAIARRLESYESRPSQLGLMRLITRGFNEDAIIAAEAGTGVGKSFAYLLPAMDYALANEERIVISTATINLQQQLYEKDIPLVSGAMNKKIKAVLIKGRGNYLCRRRLDDALREMELFDDEKENLEAIAAWGETTASGSRSDLSFLPLDTLWSRVCSEADLCMGLRCPERERCFVLALRKEAADARILVVNHHLLFADLAARSEGAGYDSTVVLPPYTRVIMDEAHTMEGAATSFFSEDFSRLGVYRQLNRLYRRRRARTLGLLLRLAVLSRQEDKLDDGAEMVQFVRDAADALDEAALGLCSKEGSFRLTPADGKIIASALFPPLQDLRKKLSSLALLIRDMLETVPEDSADDPAVWEIKSIARRLESIASVCTSFIEYRERPTEVLWIERHWGRGGFGRAGAEAQNWAVLTVTPIDVAPSLQEALFAPNKTVVCVSATLTITDSFNYWMNRSGLNLTDKEVLTGQFPSPFPYARAVLLGTPSDAPLPNDPSYRSFVDMAAAKLAEAAGGSALILFTSYESLKSAFAAAAPRLEELGIRCLKQGDDDRGRLLRTFLDDRSSVLFATDSFWEGVDAPGDTLRLVILCRLPFRTPNEPVFQARCEALERKGGSSFMELSLPEAVMKFKQGFGRLMRRSSDHGVVAVLDGRLLHKRYGEHFLRSLPETRRSFGEFNSLLQEMERFLFSGHYNQ
ncbi:probable ATP-dependent helicase YoaA [Treponema primitia ZAS-2]|uniref:Probable ATP-dependent helicase YoaA n=1 Tax=Treponema primitia (strain ATCC BAA-887 / DSM 12427 / ZAS-2) TaxID=545694 RepID=F5YGH9_TREPZ|nr:helicase C-terminal domain-containing protein [Treponema primitia]AEF86604.1 probable ATP-dependent helicase YoaA [Treponema primitia ZAS-2]